MFSRCLPGAPRWNHRHILAADGSEHTVRLDTTYHTTFLCRLMAHTHAAGLAGPALYQALMVVLLLQCALQLPLASAATTVNPVQGKILYASQTGLCGSSGPKCLGWTSATSIVCDGFNIICDSKRDVTQL